MPPWWIRAAIQLYVMRTWSLVTIGTTPAQKTLFFNLRRLKQELHAIDGGDLPHEIVGTIARRLNVPEPEVVSMNARLATREQSLNAPPELEGQGQRQDWLVDAADSQETALGEHQELGRRRRMLQCAIQTLDDRERCIITERCLRDQPTTLRELSLKFGVSHERIRQLEQRAFEKLQKTVVASARADDSAKPRIGATA